MSVYDPEAFAERVNLAAAYISAGRNATRTFDTCFEMCDGDAVAVAVYRRARHNPKLMRNLWRYLGRASVVPLAFRERRRATRDLPAWAAKQRARKAAEYAAATARWEAAAAAEIAAAE